MCNTALERYFLVLTIHAAKPLKNGSKADTTTDNAISSVRQNELISAIVCLIFECHGVNGMIRKSVWDGSKEKYISNAVS